MDLLVTAARGATTGLARWDDVEFPCMLGRTGLAVEKREGDGGTPIGRFSFRQVFYRADRVSAPQTDLPLRAIDRRDGWCDDPSDPHYNQLVRLPFAASHEELWREDHIYDLILVIGHNDDPVVPGAGSAVFIHLMRHDATPTAGCIAFTEGDLRQILAEASMGDAVKVEMKG